jgi:hypothetical protein
MSFFDDSAYGLLIPKIDESVTIDFTSELIDDKRPK